MKFALTPVGNLSVTVKLYSRVLSWDVIKFSFSEVSRVIVLGLTPRIVAAAGHQVGLFITRTTFTIVDASYFAAELPFTGNPIPAKEAHERFRASGLSIHHPISHRYSTAFPYVGEVTPDLRAIALKSLKILCGGRSIAEHDQT